MILHGWINKRHPSAIQNARSRYRFGYIASPRRAGDVSPLFQIALMNHDGLHPESDECDLIDPRILLLDTNESLVKLLVDFVE